MFNAPINRASISLNDTHECVLDVKLCQSKLIDRGARVKILAKIVIFDQLSISDDSTQ